MVDLHAGCELRPMSNEDIDTVARIEAVVHPVPWSPQAFRDCLKAGYLCDAIIRDDEVVGYQVVSEVLDEAHLLNIAVAPALQRRGLAWAALRHTVERCRSHGMTIFYLEVRESNAPALALYQHLGFVVTGRRKAYYRCATGREDAVLMMKVLKGHRP